MKYSFSYRLTVERADGTVENLSEQSMLNYYKASNADYNLNFDETNLINNILPYVEANYNVSTEKAGRALCGLSAGAACGLYLLSSGSGLPADCLRRFEPQ